MFAGKIYKYRENGVVMGLEDSAGRIKGTTPPGREVLLYTHKASIETTTREELRGRTYREFVNQLRDMGWIEEDNDVLVSIDIVHMESTQGGLHYSCWGAVPTD